MKLSSSQIACLYLVSVGLNGSPSGHVYAKSMAGGVTLDQHYRIVATLVSAGLMTQENHYLTLTDKGQAMHAEIAQVLVNA